MSEVYIIICAQYTNVLYMYMYIHVCTYVVLKGTGTYYMEIRKMAFTKTLSLLSYNYVFHHEMDHCYCSHLSVDLFLFLPLATELQMEQAVQT